MAWFTLSIHTNCSKHKRFVHHIMCSVCQRWSGMKIAYARLRTCWKQNYECVCLNLIFRQIYADNFTCSGTNRNFAYFSANLFMWLFIMDLFSCLFLIKYNYSYYEESVLGHLRVELGKSTINHVNKSIPGNWREDYSVGWLEMIVIPKIWVY